MPRRSEPDPLALKIGLRIRKLRQESGLSLEKLAYESELGSKGHLSDVERGLTRPTVTTLKTLADRLGVALLDLVTFPDEDDRQRRIDRERHVRAQHDSQAYTSPEDSLAGLSIGEALPGVREHFAEIAAELGQRIRRARLAAGCTEDELAATVGLEPAQLRQLERGAIDSTVTLLVRIAEALDLDFWRLVGGAGRSKGK